MLEAFVLGMQFDAPIGIVKLLGGSTDPDDFYDAVGITPSYRPGYGTRKKKSSTKKKATKASSKKLIKEFDPELYEQMYGVGSDIYDAKQEYRKQIKDALQE